MLMVAVVVVPATGEVGANATVTPTGNVPSTATITSPVSPALRVSVIVVAADVPAATLALVDDKAIEMLGAAETVSTTLTVRAV